MQSRGRLWLLVGLIVLAVGEGGSVIWKRVLPAVQLHRVAIAQAHAQVLAQARENAPSSLAGKQGHLFSAAEVYAFLAKAKRAEAIKDPLQRCLAYPDPPGSHWSPVAVKAYCQYRFQPIIAWAQVQALIEGGEAAELDRRMAATLQLQLSQPDASGRLDRTFVADFNNGAFDVRQTLDAWKRASPNSAFAFAASGYAYVAMAFQARGTANIEDTAQGNVDSMGRLLGLADADLRQAIKREPRLTPAYKAMVNAGGAGLGLAYANSAAQHGLRLAPTNYAIYNASMWVAEPRWDGSLLAMRQLAAAAQAHAADNPLLTLLRDEEPAYEANVDDCDCHTAAQLALYPVALDEVAKSDLLLKAGNAAASSHHPELSVVYFSETLRFAPDLDDTRLRRIYDLVNFDEAQWGVDEASRMLQAAPGNEGLFKARGWGYESLINYPRAEQDYQRALALDASDEWALLELGRLYLNNDHAWDKAWDVADRLVQTYPAKPYGWLLRADIQQGQPRAGLADTIDYVAAHFDTNPQAHGIVLKMRAALALQSKSLAHAAPASAGR